MGKDENIYKSTHYLLSNVTDCVAGTNLKIKNTNKFVKLKNKKELRTYALSNQVQ